MPRNRLKPTYITATLLCFLWLALSTFTSAIVFRDNQPSGPFLGNELTEKWAHKGAVRIRKLLQSEELWNAARDGDLEAVEKEIAAGADLEVERGEDSHTALGIASLNGHLAVVEELIAAGADVNAEDKQGATALALAAQAGKLDIVLLLLANGADPNLWDLHRTVPLHGAADVGNLAIVEALLAAGAEVNRDNEAGLTPLILAAEHGHVKVVKALLEAGADPNKSEQFRITPLHVVTSILGKNAQRIVNALLDAGANINAQTRAGHTPLNDAAFVGNARVVALLLRRGADPSIGDDSDNLAVDVVCGCTANRGTRRGPKCPKGGCDKPDTKKNIERMLS